MRQNRQLSLKSICAPTSWSSMNASRGSWLPRNASDSTNSALSATSSSSSECNDQEDTKPRRSAVAGRGDGSCTGDASSGSRQAAASGARVDEGGKEQGCARQDSRGR